MVGLQPRAPLTAGAHLDLLTFDRHATQYRCPEPRNTRYRPVGFGSHGTTTRSYHGFAAALFSLSMRSADEDEAFTTNAADRRGDPCRPVASAEAGTPLADFPWHDSVVGMGYFPEEVALPSGWTWNASTS